MRNPKRKIAFVLAASDHGTMIVNRFDYRMVDERSGIGVGFQILEGGSFDAQEVDLALSLLGFRRQYFGDSVLALDCGANIGVHTIEWAKRMSGWGQVIAIEPQERPVLMRSPATSRSTTASMPARSTRRSRQRSEPCGFRSRII